MNEPMSFPCNECQAPTSQSSDPDRWLCATCGLTPPPAEGKPAFAQPDVLEREEIPVERVIQAMQEMASDNRIANEPVKAIFQRAADLLTDGVHAARAGDATPYRHELKAAQVTHRKSMMESGIDPAGDMGMLLRASFLAGWKVARARG